MNPIIVLKNNNISKLGENALMIPKHEDRKATKNRPFGEEQIYLSIEWKALIFKRLTHFRPKKSAKNPQKMEPKKNPTNTTCVQRSEGREEYCDAQTRSSTTSYVPMSAMPLGIHSVPIRISKQQIKLLIA